jgi:tetratricopeptide (TPR) repeat protein
MLFDLRGRGRRRTVKIVYILLAVLMGGGLVLFGIGGGGAMQGGLVDAITGSSGGDTGTSRFEAKERQALVATQQRPQDAAAWAALARARVQTAGVGDNFDPNAAAYTASGKAKLAAAADAWDKYLALDPKHPDDRVAGLMVRAFDQTGLNRPDEAVKAQEIITEARPKDTTFATLAIYAYQAGQTRKGDLAAQKALELAPKDQKNTLKSQLDQAKQAALQAQVQNATPTPTATATPKKKK